MRGLPVRNEPFFELFSQETFPGLINADRILCSCLLVPHDHVRAVPFMPRLSIPVDPLWVRCEIGFICRIWDPLSSVLLVPKPLHPCAQHAVKRTGNCIRPRGSRHVHPAGLPLDTSRKTKRSSPGPGQEVPLVVKPAALCPQQAGKVRKTPTHSPSTRPRALTCHHSTTRLRRLNPIGRHFDVFIAN